ncbi:MAG: TonB-dependent receptor plug domain-containing protein [Deltaproteobacteria bacterium]|nr:TonB-dependent receptor plug domain-containing protein [Deltaproteobacteria bacterium]
MIKGAVWGLIAALIIASGRPLWAGGPENGRVIISADEISAMKVSKIYEILNRVPGVAASTSSVSIHGSYKVKVFLDGAPITDPSSGYNAVVWDHLAPENVDRIEVILDSGGLIYGQDASAGVVLITGKAAEKFQGSLKVYGGDYGLFRSEAEVTATKGLWGISAMAGREENGGFEPNEDKLIYRGSLKVSRRLTDGLISLSASLLDDERGLYGYPGFPTPEARKRNRLFMLGQETKVGRLANNFSYQRGRVANTDPSRAIDQYLMVSEAADNLAMSLEPTGWASLFLGTGFKKSWAESSDFSPQSETFWHFFARTELKLPMPGLVLAMGARYNYNSNFKNNWNPESALSFSRGGFRAALKYSRAANTPSYQQRYNRSSSTVPNPSLDLETADNYGLVLAWQATEKMSWHLNGFYNRLKGRITYDRPANSGVGRYRNLGVATYEGGDLGFDWKTADFLAVKANLTYMRAKDKDINKNLTGRSRLSGSTEIIFKPAPEFSAVLTVDYRTPAWSDRLNTDRIPGYALYHLRAEWDLGRFSLFFNMENILNRSWLYSDGLNGPPRNFYAGAVCRF